jgi:hypothetical protein
MSHRWVDLNLKGQGPVDPHCRQYTCVPCWDITAVYDRPDATLGRQDSETGKTIGIFWDRHLDDRFWLSYPASTRDGHRMLGSSVSDPCEAWDIAQAQRAHILKESGCGAGSSQRETAKALADWFLFDRFKHRVTCPAFPANPRELHSGFEGIFYQSFCTGCARAYAILGDLSGLATRTIGCNGHIVAEVLLESRWHLVENAGRHGPGLGALFNDSYIHSYVNPDADFGIPVPEDYRAGLLKRPNPQFHFHDGQWDSPLTLRWSMQNARSLYPDAGRIPCKAEPGNRLPLVRYAKGFFWPIVHSSDEPALASLRQSALAYPASTPAAIRDFLFHPFCPGQALRHTFTLGDLRNVQGIELLITFGADAPGDLDDGLSGLELQINGVGCGLSGLMIGRPNLGANPIGITVGLPRHLLVENGVNEVRLVNNGKMTLSMPCAPGVLNGMPSALGLG